MILKALLTRLASIGKTIRKRNGSRYPVSEFSDYTLRDIGLRREEGKIVSRFEAEWENPEPGNAGTSTTPICRETTEAGAARAFPAGQPSIRCPRCGAAVT
ncbi:hypothetical protein [Salinicola halophilus]|uniref:hypothetical protein n=1 Tax=Salinicola halophilus TaxID=184065 RepID=UPI0013A663C5|nr:hypothetical protein [Salinicola halophilus]